MAKKIILFFSGVIFSALVLTTACSADTVYTAMVEQINGNALVIRRSDNKDTTVSLNTGDLLYADDRVTVGDKSSLTINYFSSGRKEKWPQNMKFTVGQEQTADLPAGVEVVTEKVELPDSPFLGHMGGYVEKSISRDRTEEIEKYKQMVKEAEEGGK